MQKWQKSVPEIHGVESGDITKRIPLNPLGRALENLAVAQLVKNFPHFVLDTKIHYRVYNIPQLDNILKLMNEDHKLTFCIFMIHVNIILPYMTTAS